MIARNRRKWAVSFRKSVPMRQVPYIGPKQRQGGHVAAPEKAGAFYLPVRSAPVLPCRSVGGRFCVMV